MYCSATDIMELQETRHKLSVGKLHQGRVCMCSKASNNWAIQTGLESWQIKIYIWKCVLKCVKNFSEKVPVNVPKMYQKSIWKYNLQKMSNKLYLNVKVVKFDGWKLLPALLIRFNLHSFQISKYSMLNLYSEKVQDENKIGFTSTMLISRLAITK